MPNSSPSKLTLWMEYSLADLDKRNASASVQIKSIERIPSRDQKVLLAVEQIRFRRIRDLPQTRVPEWFTERGVIGDQIASHIATEDEPARRSKQAVHPSTRIDARIAMAPCDFARLVINRRQIIVQRRDAQFFFAPQAHRAARVGFGQVIHRVIVRLRHVKQSGVGRETRWGPVCHAAVIWRNERAADMVILFGDAFGRPALVNTFGPIDRV